MSIKFANIAKIGAIVVVGGILVLNTKSCIEGQIELAERKKRAQREVRADRGSP